MRFIQSLVTLSPLLVVLAACVGAPARPPEPAPRPTPTPAPVQPATPAPQEAQWQYRPATPGNWTWRNDSGGSVASFVSGTDVLLVIRCDRAARRVAFTRMGAGQGTMIVRTSYGAVTWPTSDVVAGQQAQSTAVRAASDNVLDQIAYSRGKFAVEVPGLAPLILPAWAEVGRVVEDCRG